MRRLLNTQYIEFIIEQVARPYQGMLGYDRRIDRLMFVQTSDTASILYANLLIYSNSRKEWFDQVVDRLSRCYEAIDFSFFPNDAFANELQKALISKGVKPINYF